MKKLFIAFAMAVMTAIAANAQASLVQENDYESFSSVNISDDFIVKLNSSDKYSVKTIADERVSSYVSCYVKNGVLYVSLDRKNFTPELKKQLKAKGSAKPVLEVEVYFPMLKSLEMSDNANVQISDVIKAENFTLVLKDKAKVNKINIESETAEVTLSKSAYANVEATTSKTLYVTTENTAQAIVKHFGNAISMVASGSSMQNVESEVVNMNADLSGGSTVEVKGSAAKLQVKGSATSRLTAEALAADNASVEQTGSSKCHVNVSGNILVNLTGGAMLTFMGKPTIEVDRIVNSTLIKHDDPRRK
ncbi:MAG: DUF2807 domain-containing protein [Bacteroidales bacterium]|nr:DUF2807 domain-containing protein [Bacteroidales bacterium]